MQTPNHFRHKLILEYRDFRTDLRLTFRNILVFSVLSKGSVNKPIQNKLETIRK